eukprot:gnl/TRDRNA2_/TRDRNA2_32556_c0_seq1.p1 gnl/TRDRNA2_/TRDRNA2_32556_c0~~gnl/TRDRNA2_/TRDRNA2_32556_c0_seq1.p1  ORF type:complete len:212 (+),score=5.19 gnl/TRDRNA2_/TRDRNA2_32556_c0_seq1:326-961(+)
MRYRFNFIGLLSIGAGSFAFHATLMFGAQLLDELPMIWATSAFVYCAAEPLGLGSRGRALLRVILTGYAVGVSALYTTVFRGIPTFLEATYGALVVTLIVLVVLAIWRSPSEHTWLLRGLFWRALCSYGLGFALWNVDNIFCEDVRALRERLGPGLSPALQLHAWWHIAQVGTYTCCVLLVMLRHCRTGMASVRFTCCGLVPLLQTGKGTQ